LATPALVAHHAIVTTTATVAIGKLWPGITRQRADVATWARAIVNA